MSKKLRALFLAITLVFTLNAKNSQAALGLSYAAPAVIVLSLAGLAVTGVSAHAGYKIIKKGHTIGGLAVLAVSLLGAYWGVLFLEGGQEARFTELSEAAATELGLSSEERLIYNSEIEQLNAIAREIGEELEVHGTDNVEQARDLWIELGTQLSPETMKTVIAIASQK